jgi:ABC-2 type transport system permease protein
MNSIINIAKFELFRQKDQPLVIITIFSLGFMMFIEVMGNLLSISGSIASISLNEFIEISLRNSFWYMTFFFSFLALCLGVILIAEERHKGTLGVLLTKPLYRRDIILGKIIGINAFLFILIAIAMTIFAYSVFVSFGIMGYQESFNLSEFLPRIISYDILLFFYCVTTFNLMMLISVLFKDLANALIIAFAYLYIAWFYGMNWMGQFIIIDPYYMYANTFNANGVILLAMASPFTEWLNGAIPNIILLLLEAIGISLLVCIMFARIDA